MLGLRKVNRCGDDILDPGGICGSFSLGGTRSNIIGRLFGSKPIGRTGVICRGQSKCRQKRVILKSMYQGSFVGRVARIAVDGWVYHSSSKYVMIDLGSLADNIYNF